MVDDGNSSGSAGTPPSSAGGAGMAPTNAGIQKRKARSGPLSRTSPFIGVSQYKRTGRWESHIWDAGEPGESKGRQLHLGSYESAIQAARAYDRAALMMRGPSAETNFDVAEYAADKLLASLRGLSKKEIIMAIRTSLDDEQDGVIASSCKPAVASPRPSHSHPPRPSLKPPASSTSPTTADSRVGSMSQAAAAAIAAAAAARSRTTATAAAAGAATANRNLPAKVSLASAPSSPLPVPRQVHSARTTSLSAGRRRPSPHAVSRHGRLVSSGAAEHTAGQIGSSGRLDPPGLPRPRPGGGGSSPVGVPASGSRTPPAAPSNRLFVASARIITASELGLRGAVDDSTSPWSHQDLQAWSPASQLPQQQQRQTASLPLPQQQCRVNTGSLSVGSDPCVPQHAPGVDAAAGSRHGFLNLGPMGSLPGPVHSPFQRPALHEGSSAHDQQTGHRSMLMTSSMSAPLPASLSAWGTADHDSRQPHVLQQMPSESAAGGAFLQQWNVLAPPPSPAPYSLLQQPASGRISPHQSVTGPPTSDMPQQLWPTLDFDLLPSCDFLQIAPITDVQQQLQQHLWQSLAATPFASMSSPEVEQWPDTMDQLASPQQHASQGAAADDMHQQPGVSTLVEFGRQVPRDPQLSKCTPSFPLPHADANSYRLPRTSLPGAFSTPASANVQYDLSPDGTTAVPASQRPGMLMQTVRQTCSGDVAAPAAPAVAAGAEQVREPQSSPCYSQHLVQTDSVTQGLGDELHSAFDCMTDMRGCGSMHLDASQQAPAYVLASALGFHPNDCSSGESGGAVAGGLRDSANADCAGCSLGKTAVPRDMQPLGAQHAADSSQRWQQHLPGPSTAGAMADKSHLPSLQYDMHGQQCRSDARFEELHSADGHWNPGSEYCGSNRIEDRCEDTGECAGGLLLHGNHFGDSPPRPPAPPSSACATPMAIDSLYGVGMGNGDCNVNDDSSLYRELSVDMWAALADLLGVDDAGGQRRGRV